MHILEEENPNHLYFFLVQSIWLVKMQITLRENQVDFLLVFGWNLSYDHGETAIISEERLMAILSNIKLFNNLIGTFQTPSRVNQF